MRSSMIMMVTVYIGIVVECPRYERADCLVCISRNTAIKLYVCRCKRVLRPSADSAAEQCIDTVLRKESRKRPMAAPLRIHNLFVLYCTIFYFIKFKLLCVSEVLKNHSIFIGYCYFHIFIFLSFIIFQIHAHIS